MKVFLKGLERYFRFLGIHGKCSLRPLRDKVTQSGQWDQAKFNAPGRVKHKRHGNLT